ncbi:unnamed protein product [Tilletia controversa]|uniref:Uncharacterized protein n=3 Tax=Tilletia TaxID=13289 RepID=A0A8X7STA8_9BASI|nr:hypothetical protein CF336_g6786 [Tilletia laevis]KAE8191114.1 hypothetical protein CF328_g5778 [Tilletia controversa]KAE8252862.1 hypothetical protein A4X03_0g6055 [Tilletia caries]KAE8192342.1 hypothetical protein CF335_g5858 [Tilletia laevis]KAE8239361.1 hypothetical protein A4X06_0g8305 [Tilletia controversa]
MSRRPQSRISAFFGSLGRSSEPPAAPPSPSAAAAAAEGGAADDGSSSSNSAGYGATAQTASTSTAPAPALAPAPSSAFAPPRSRTFFKRKRPDPREAWHLNKRPPYQRKRVRALFGAGVLLLILSLVTAGLLLLNLFEPIPALIPSSNSPGTASLCFAFSAALIIAPSLMVFELSSKATYAVHSTSTGILGLALLLIVAVAPLRREETLLCAPTIALALIACAWALLSSAVVGKLQVAYAIGAPPGIFVPTGEQPHPPAPAAAVDTSSQPQRTRANDDDVDIEASDERTPLLTVYTTSVQRAQRGWHRVVKLTLAIIGTLTISVLIGLQSFNLLLTGTDAGLHPVGDRVLIDPAAQEGQQLQYAAALINNDTTDAPARPLPNWFRAVPAFKMHVACESSPPHTGHQGQSSHPSRPTALFFAERGVAGQIGADWIRDMVHRAAEGDDYGNGPGGENSTDDGHLSLEKVCFFDRVGYGHSDFVGGVEGVASVRLHTFALHSGLGTLGVLNGSYPLDPDQPGTNESSLFHIHPTESDGVDTFSWSWPWGRRKSTTKPPASPSPPSPPHGGHSNHSANGTSPPFMLIAQGYGALHARHFAAIFPNLVHSLLYIDAETPTSFYTPAISSASGLRAGYGAWGHAWGLHTLGFVLYDVLPALVEPLGVVRLGGMIFLGRGARDRVLAPRWRGGARKGDAGGGGWRLVGAGGANARLLSTSLAERLDANRGAGDVVVPDHAAAAAAAADGDDDNDTPAVERTGGSKNYRDLTAPSVIEAHKTELARRPTAILSSFWKVHADIPGWAEIQRTELVKVAREGDGLVGWWRLGSPARMGGGGDRGEAGGICAESLGRIYCEEAVRKLLAQGDLDERHRREKEKEGGKALNVDTERERVRVFDERDDLDPLKPWPREQRGVRLVQA